MTWHILFQFQYFPTPASCNAVLFKIKIHSNNFSSVAIKCSLDVLEIEYSNTKLFKFNHTELGILCTTELYAQWIILKHSYCAEMPRLSGQFSFNKNIFFLSKFKICLAKLGKDIDNSNLKFNVQIFPEQFCSSWLSSELRGLD